MKIKFTKMQGIGNDYIYINCLDKEPKLDWQDVTRKICRRHFGVGSDGLILILPSKKADYRMRMFNSDGSEAEINGNGIRGFVKYIYDNKISGKKKYEIETLAGVRTVWITKFVKGKAACMRVNMAEPILDAEKIPIKAKGQFINQEFDLENQCVRITCLSFGNPHCVLFLDSFSIPVEKLGYEVENHKFFPNRVNVEFVQVVNKNEINIQVWERGVGVSLACGTGACAAAVASVLNKKTNRKVRVHLLGGDLDIEWNKDDNNVYMEGPVEEVFSGEIDIK